MLNTKQTTTVQKCHLGFLQFRALVFLELTHLKNCILW
jgi:hypothetical protein